jgi:hypothetical protein
MRPGPCSSLRTLHVLAGCQDVHNASLYAGQRLLAAAWIMIHGCQQCHAYPAEGYPGSRPTVVYLGMYLEPVLLLSVQFGQQRQATAEVSSLCTFTLYRQATGIHC